jgi:hypothetical protein
MTDTFENINQFRQSGAVDISFADPTLIPGGYHIPRIHSPRDDDFTPERFWPLIQALGDYVQLKPRYTHYRANF